MTVTEMIAAHAHLPDPARGPSSRARSRGSGPVADAGDGCVIDVVPAVTVPGDGLGRESRWPS